MYIYEAANARSMLSFHLVCKDTYIYIYTKYTVAAARELTYAVTYAGWAARRRTWRLCS